MWWIVNNYIVIVMIVTYLIGVFIGGKLYKKLSPILEKNRLLKEELSFRINDILLIWDMSELNKKMLNLKNIINNNAFCYNKVCSDFIHRWFSFHVNGYEIDEYHKWDNNEYEKLKKDLLILQKKYNGRK